MKRLLNFSVAIAVLIILIVFASKVNADVAEPGSKDDPLVTKSYVDSIFSNLKQYFESKLNNQSNESVSFEIVYMEAGQKLIGEKGTELILRSGIATAVDSGSGGLADVTEGKDLKNGENVSQNHLLIVPRNDGRGVEAKTDNVILLVKGGYSIIK